MDTSNRKNGFSVRAYRGDAKTLLAFDLSKAKATRLAGFTVQVAPKGRTPYYLLNQLRFADPSKHAQDASQPANSTFNAPLHKFRWVHIPGSMHQGTTPFLGPYTYTVTPRYFDAQGSLLPIDASLAVAVTVDVKPFSNGRMGVGFTRGFTQSQAFVHHFGPKATFRPKGKALLFDTSQKSGTNSAGTDYTYAEEYAWLGFTARDKIFALAKEVLKDKSLRLDVFAYDLNEPDLMTIFLALAKQGRIRVILDNAALHHNTETPKPEDQFETLFTKAAKAPAQIMRGHFGRYAHDKVLLVSKVTGKKRVPRKVLTGSTNFSITGLYVNSNHILVFDDPKVAATYAKVFDDAWSSKATMAFAKNGEANQSFTLTTSPEIDATFSPHPKPFAKQTLDDLAVRIAEEGKQPDGSVLFAVMGLAKGTGPVLPALRNLHANEKIFSYGISDDPGGIHLYTPRRKTGVLATGKPTKTKLPPPFDQVPGVGIGHQVHHKFVVCGFRGKKPVVYCGSSNLAQGGEEENGDNLLAVHDADIATVFVIEALTLVDHFDFLDRSGTVAKTKPAKITSASKTQQAENAGWFLSTSDGWVHPYFDTGDLRCADRELFA
jgi:hypothetical protein